VRIYAHRGSPGSCSVDGLLENTLPAVSTCLRDGADGVEVDLRLSADGVLVVCHDPTLRRIAGSGLTVATSTWEELRTMSARVGVPLTRVEDVLAVLAGRPVVLEVKRPLPGAVPPTVAALVQVLGALHGSALPLDVTVSSFSPAVVLAVRETAPAELGLRTALLGDVRDRPTRLLRHALDAGHDQVHPQVAALLTEPAAVERAHALGVGVVPWTVNRGRALRRVAALGVDGIITDVPTYARLALRADARAAA
jgi:glycerophosphoryl diester phosphodiesterase